MGGDFWGISAVFVPTASSAILSNLRLFSDGLRRQNLPLLVVELAFGDKPFVVPDTCADRVVRLRTDTVLWQKERLLNVAVAALPPECRYVAWLDADILFENDTWVADTRDRLADTPVVQPFDTACWMLDGMTRAPADLPEGHLDGHQAAGFAAALAAADDRARHLAGYAGHSGFAWAAGRALIARHGLYDRAILGGGDFINAHAFAGDHRFIQGVHLYLRDVTKAERAAITAWGTAVSRETGGRIGWTPGRVCHLYHGPLTQRGYMTRTRILREAAFDPLSDIAEDVNGCWRWNTDKPELHRRTWEYFASRAFPPTPESALDAAPSPQA